MGANLRTAAVSPVPPFPIAAAEVVVEIRGDPRRPGGRLVLQDGVESSYIDIAEPTRLEFEYLRHLSRAVDAMHPKRLPMAMMQIGGGPCAFPRYLDATRRDLRAVVVERDPGVIGIAREWLGLCTSPRLEVRIGDGREALTQVPPASLDLVVVDAFTGVLVPHHLATGEFAEIARAALRPGGLHVVNLIDIPPLGYAAAAVATLCDHYTSVIVLADRETIERRSSGNLVLVASDRPIPDERLARFARLDPDPWDVLSGRRLERLVDGAAPLADDVAPDHPLATLSPLWGRSRGPRAAVRP